MSDVKVAVIQQTPNSPYKIEVSLKSEVPTMSGPLWSYGILAIDNNIISQVQKAGAAIATRQNLTRGDNHDPAEVARLAKEAFNRVLVEFGMKNPAPFVS